MRSESPGTEIGKEIVLLTGPHLGMLELSVAFCPVRWTGWIDVTGRRHLQGVGLHSHVRIVLPDEVDASHRDPGLVGEACDEGCNRLQGEVEILSVPRPLKKSTFYSDLLTLNMIYLLWQS